MARILLVNPPSPEPVRTPLLAFGYLAAALERAGHAVALVDASAPFAPRTPDEIHARARDFDADLVGLHVKTLHVQPAYALARELASRGLRLVAGGPHPTVRPLEPLDHGFAFSVTGEGEEVLPALASAIDGDGDGDFAIPGLALRTAAGEIRALPRRGFLTDLDALASPVPMLRHFDPAWYGAAGKVAYGGVLSSRGCPAACTFCANDVTGRRFRYRDPALVAAEIVALRDGWGARTLTFFDDSFAVGRRRLTELSEALAAARAPSWSCTAHPAHLDLATLAAMKRAGCGGIDIGMESGDPDRLVAIGKGVTRERVLDVLAACRDLGLHVVVNLMFGWPGETEAELDRTISFMHEAAALGAMWNARGVLVPYPGTEIYERHHREHGFTDWWLVERPIEYAPFPTSWSRDEVERAYAADAALARNFFRHPPAVLRRIEEALDDKARLTFRRLLDRAPAVGAVPAAGAR